MPVYYRLFRGKYAATDSTGAFLAGGRWNRKGVHMLYASNALSLSCLEVLVHVREPRLPLDYAWVKIDVRKALLDAVRDTGLNIQDDDACTSWGTEWIRTGATPAVEVPSVIVPTEKNLLLNPKHPRFAEIGFSTPKPFHFDPRLLKVGPIRAL